MSNSSDDANRSAAAPRGLPKTRPMPMPGAAAMPGGAELGARYEILKLIGRGGMGEVYLGRHKTIGKLVAIKLLNDEHRHNPQVVQRFLQEARAASQIRHENIVDITDFGETSTRSVYLVMEYLEGEGLDRLIAREGPLPWPRVRGIAVQILRALAAAHARGIVHRDMKPENCQIVPRQGASDFVKVLDFGIAKVTRPDGDAGGLTRTGMIMGTAKYMSPEQAQGFHTDHRTDIYAVGVMLFEMLTGRPPFEGDSALAVLSRHLHEEPPPMRDVVRSDVTIAEPLERIVGQALSKSPEQRFPDAERFIEALESVDISRPAPGVPKTRAPMAAPARARGPVVMAAGGGLLVCGLAGYVVLSSAEAGDEAATVQASDRGDEEADGRVEAAPSENVVIPEPAPPPPCGADMVQIAGGSFFMGSAGEHPALASARPPHQVEVSPYCLDIHEVTLGDYRACSTKGQCQRAFRESLWPQGSTSQADWEAQRQAYGELCNERDDNRLGHPVNCVTWQQASHYCELVGKRLPTEAEWEFAARGSDGRVYPWGDDAPDQRHMNGCGTECTAWREAHGLDGGPSLHQVDDGFAGTSPVGTFASGKTEAGLFDMIGNVFEWTADEFRPYPGAEGADGEAPGRVIRGGAFNSFLPMFADPALRFAMDPDMHSHGIGFRCASAVRGAD